MGRHHGFPESRIWKAEEISLLRTVLHSIRDEDVREFFGEKKTDLFRKIKEDKSGPLDFS